MVNEFKVGTNFDEEIIDIAAQLNDKYSNHGKIVEFYGSDRAHAALAARPDFRLHDITEEQLKHFVKKASDNGMTFNYTMNSIFPYMTKSELVAHKQEIQDWVKKLEDFGVYRITIATPIMAAIVREVSDIEIELSTIAHIDAVSQMKIYWEMFHINKFCGNILKNRSKPFLVNAAKWCNEHSIIYEMMTQEFCYNTAKTEHCATHCIFRDSCYICHAGNKTKEDALAYGNYPMGYCIGSRENEEEGWLKSRWIRPEDLHYYNKIGIKNFKLTGRTGTSEYMKKVMEAYMSQSYDGNLLELWKPLETIYNGQAEKDWKLAYDIPNKKLDGFIDHWFNGNGFECENEICGETCNYCRKWWLNNLAQ